MTTTTHILGYLRICEKRELKFTLTCFTASSTKSLIQWPH